MSLEKLALSDFEPAIGENLEIVDESSGAAVTALELTKATALPLIDPLVKRGVFTLLRGPRFGGASARNLHVSAFGSRRPAHFCCPHFAKCGHPFLSGCFQLRNQSMSQPFVGEIRAVGFNFAPVGWSFCNGALVPISQYDTLFDLIGTTYGGDGQQTFALPNLQGRVAIHQGNDGIGNEYVMGQLGGVETITLTSNAIPAHGHTFSVNSSPGTTLVPTNGFLASAPLALGFLYGIGATTPMGNNINNSGGSQPHDNMQPFLAINYIISFFGVFPTQG